LLDIEIIKKWLTKDIQTLNNNEFKIFGSNIPNNWSNTILNIKNTQESDNKVLILWTLVNNNLKLQIAFTLHDKLPNTLINIEMEILCQFNIANFIDEWIIEFYNLKFYLEGNIKIPILSYNENYSNEIQLEINITEKPEKIFKSLVHREYMNKIFSRYPEVNVATDTYTWGWISEGPSNLLLINENELLIHDFLVDHTPIGIVYWELNEIESNKSKLVLKHKELDLGDEINQSSAYNAYKHGWLLLLLRIKDISENNYLNFDDSSQILD